MLQCVAVCCSVLQCVAVCCSLLQNCAVSVVAVSVFVMLHFRMPYKYAHIYIYDKTLLLRNS